MSRDTIVTGSKLTALANSIRTKAGTQASMTLDQMKTAVDNISTGGGVDDFIIAFCNKTLSGNITIPSGVTNIPQYFFYNQKYITKVVLPNTVNNIEQYAFSNISYLNEINIPHGVKGIYYYAFGYDYALKTVTIPNTLTYVESAFAACSQLEFVTMENGFNCNNLYLQGSTLYSAATIVSWLNALADRTGQTAYTLYIGSTNLSKLTAAEIAIATNKNWNLA